MRKLSEILDDVRSGKTVDPRELKYAVVAFDVMVAALDLGSDPHTSDYVVELYQTPPDEACGEANDPENPEAIEWYVGGIQALTAVMNGSADDEA